MRTEGQKAKNAPPIHAQIWFLEYLARKQKEPKLPSQTRKIDAIFGPMRNPNGMENAKRLTFVAIKTHANARLVPCKYIGDHHGKPVWSINPW